MFKISAGRDNIQAKHINLSLKSEMTVPCDMGDAEAHVCLPTNDDIQIIITQITHLPYNQQRKVRIRVMCTT